MIVNTGALAARWTNDTWNATAHRVIVPSTPLETIVVFGFYVPGTLPLISLMIFVANLYRTCRKKYYLYRSSLS